MGRGNRAFPYVVATALLLTLAACGDSDGPDADPTPTPSATPTDATTSPSPTSSSTPDDQASGGTADAPTAVEPRTDLLDWQPVDGSVEDAVTRNGEWSLSIPQDGSTWRLEKVTADRGSSSGQAGANPGWKVSDGLLDEDWAVVVLQDENEEKPSRATVTNLETGKAFEIDGRSDVPTTNGGTWALGDDRLLHATIDRGAYCLASVDLETRRSSVEWCAPEQHGFNAGHVTEDGISLLTFDNAETSCRTVASIAGNNATPFPGAPECKAWEGLLLEDAAVWSVIPDEQRIEEAHLYARVGDGYFDLGPGTAGSLVSCDDAAYFTRDPQQKGDPAALMRWAPDDGLSVVYESPQGQAFIEQPRCGGDTMTITALTSSGDEQVSADL